MRSSVSGSALGEMAGSVAQAAPFYLENEAIVRTLVDIVAVAGRRACAVAAGRGAAFPMVCPERELTLDTARAPPLVCLNGSLHPRSGTISADETQEPSLSGWQPLDKVANPEPCQPRKSRVVRGAAAVRPDWAAVRR